jgi:polyisoprenyl-phosphate glycosyltransferase
MKPSTVIPAFNEQLTVGEVTKVVTEHPFINEVIVVNDGSTDDTSRVAKASGAVVIDLKENIGKGGAMLFGAMKADADIILFLDADLIGLTHEHVSQLLEPLMNESFHMAVGVFDNGRFATDLHQYLTPYLSGQRAVYKHIFMRVDNLETTRFGIEMALTKYIEKRGLRQREVQLEAITHIMKEEKLGLIKGFSARMKMYWEVAKWMGLK